VRIFLSYASEDRDLAEQVTLALTAEGHEVFFDKNSLPPAGDFRRSIRKAVGNSDCMVFLITTRSVARGSFALTELEHAKRKWKHPKNHVLPVRIGDVPWASIPQYLKAATVLEPIGEVADATVMAAAQVALHIGKPIDPEVEPRKRWWPRITFAFSVTLGLALISLRPDLIPFLGPEATSQVDPVSTPAGPRTTVNSILCRDPVDKRPVSPPRFDAGYRDSCRAYLYINDDEICDYCRTVGDRNQLRCTLGTPTGLNGLNSEAIPLEGGAPYPDTCEWIAYQGTKVPALRGEIGDNRELISITTVKMSTDGKQIVIGPTQTLPNVK
jgi:hypothetical protein